MQVVFENTVRFAETDAQGIVFYGNYVTYQDETMAAFMDALGYTYNERVGWDVHVVHVELDYRSQATFRDRLSNAMRIAAIHDSSMEFEYECRSADGEVIAEGSVVHVVVDEDGEPTRVPDEFREAVVAFQDEPPDPV